MNATRCRSAPVLVALAFGVLTRGCSEPRPPSSASIPETRKPTALALAVAGQQRTAEERARDRYRHPIETLSFFGFREDMTVIELSPGLGWYTAILAPALRVRGRLIVATGNPEGPPSGATRAARSLRDRLAEQPAVFDRVQPIVFGPPWTLGAPESADMVLTFRNLHNWVESGVVDKVLAAAFAVLRHGGTLGLTDHRADPGEPASVKTISETGYVPEAYAIDRAVAAGFQLMGRSEINMNPRDMKRYPHGVWSLPPTLEGGEVDREIYTAVGESDRMTLGFAKP